jgi:hypothetical protein
MKDKFHKWVRRLSKFAWGEMLWDVGRVEWKYGRTDEGLPKNWTEWDNVRDHLREAGTLRRPEELEQGGRGPDMTHDAILVEKRLEHWRAMSDQELRLRCGEMTAQEIRTVRAVLNAISIKKNHDTGTTKQTG